MDEFTNCANRLRGYLLDAEDFGRSDLEEKKDYYAASMVVFSIINESLRLAEYFMAKHALPAPATYKEIFDILLSRKMISKKTAFGMKLLVQKRNLIAHEYGEVKPGDVKDLLGNLSPVRVFMGEIAGKY